MNEGAPPNKNSAPQRSQWAKTPQATFKWHLQYFAHNNIFNLVDCERLEILLLRCCHMLSQRRQLTHQNEGQPNLQKPLEGSAVANQRGDVYTRSRTGVPTASHLWRRVVSTPSTDRTVLTTASFPYKQMQTSEVLTSERGSDSRLVGISSSEPIDD